MKSDLREIEQKNTKAKNSLMARSQMSLKKHLKSLEKGIALDLATGEGNYVFLAKAGWKVDAVDISPVGVRKARRLAKEGGVRINFMQADLDFYAIAKEKYDLISVLFFGTDASVFPPPPQEGAEKGRANSLQNLHLQTLLLGFKGPPEAKYLLKSNELLRLQGFSRSFLPRGRLPGRGQKEGNRQSDRNRRGRQSAQKAGQDQDSLPAKNL